MKKRRKDTDVQSEQQGVSHQDEEKAVNQQLKAANQQLRASEQQLQAANQQLKAHEQQLKAANQQLKAQQQQLRAANQQLRANEQQLKASNRQLLESREELRVERDRARQYLDVAGVMLLALDLDGKVQSINPRGCEVLGLSRDEIVGRDWFGDFIHSDVVPQLKEVFAKVVSGQLASVEYYENDAVRSDGTHRTIAWHNSLLHDAAGVITGVFCSGEDITDRLRMQKALLENERMLEQTSRLAKTGGWEHDLVTNTATWTRPMYELMKMDPQVPPPGPDDYWKNYPEEDRRRVQAAYRQAMETGLPAELEVRRYTADGELRWWHVYGEPVFEDGKCIKMRGMFQDITERKQTELALQQSERQLADAQRLANLGSWERGIDDDKVYCTEQMFRISGVDSDAGYVPLEYAESVIHPDDRASFEQALQRVSQSEQPTSLEYRIARPNGEFVTLSAEIGLLRNEEGVADRFIGTCRDITESVKARREIETIYEMSLDLMCIADINTATFLRVNPAFTAELGYSEDELLNRPFLEFVHPDDLDRTIAVMEDKLQKGEKLITFENRYITKSGKCIWLNWTSHPIPEEGITFAIAHDVTRRKEREERLKASERRFRSYVDSAPNGIFVTDASGKIVDTNPAMSGITGYSPDRLRAMSIVDLIAVGSEQAGRDYLNQLCVGGQADGELPLLTEDGETRWCAVSGVRLDGDRCLGFVHDISEMRRLQHLASRAERLETAGTIAGQVAHDFNNLLGPVMAYPDLIRDELPADHPARDYLDDIESAARKMSEINQDLLTMGRRGHFTQEVLDLNQVVRHAFREIIPRTDTLRCHLDLAADLLNVKGGRAQIHRMLANLLVNARDAVQDIGEISIRTENYYADNTTVAYGRVPKGEYIKLTIADTGCGIPQDIIERVFDPFFTTKSADKKRGSGLGLSVVDAVVKDHGGYLDLESKVGEGTSFYIYFPVTRDTPGEPEPAHSLTGSEKVLVVDDDPVQREVCRTLLQKLGYLVHAVDSGEAAVEAVTSYDPDLLVLDMVMPGGIDGTETFRRVREMRPSQRAIILSGYSETARVLEAQRMGAGAFVRKPLTKATLASVVRTELDRK
jgi:PAS domain S-box-containing protein